MPTYSSRFLAPCFASDRHEAHVMFHPSIHRPTTHPHYRPSVRPLSNHQTTQPFPLNKSPVCTANACYAGAKQPAPRYPWQQERFLSCRYYGRQCPTGDEALVPSIRLSRIVCFSSCRQAYSILSTSYQVSAGVSNIANNPDNCGTEKRVCTFRHWVLTSLWYLAMPFFKVRDLTLPNIWMNQNWPCKISRS
jgi:hypothetical protein